MSTRHKSPSESESEIADQSFLHVVMPDEDLSPDIDRRYGLARALMATIREPAVFLDRHLRTVAASRSYSQMCSRIRRPIAHSASSNPWVGRIR
jgi:hypothetical protein